LAQAAGKIMSKRLSSKMPSILILLFVIGYLITAYLTLDATTRRVPVLFGFLTLALLVMDISSNRVTAGESGGPTSPAREITAILFVAGGVSGIYLLGFLVAIPLYLVLSITYLGAQPLRVALLVALIASGSIYLIFEVALSYRLFPGILFS
jgi:hypothetical protein